MKVVDCGYEMKIEFDLIVCSFRSALNWISKPLFGKGLIDVLTMIRVLRIREFHIKMRFNKGSLLELGRLIRLNRKFFYQKITWIRNKGVLKLL